jgi:hypothetical protein
MNQDPGSYSGMQNAPNTEAYSNSGYVGDVGGILGSNLNMSMRGVAAYQNEPSSFGQKVGLEGNGDYSRTGTGSNLISHGMPAEMGQSQNHSWGYNDFSTHKEPGYDSHSKGIPYANEAGAGRMPENELNFGMESPSKGGSFDQFSSARLGEQPGFDGDHMRGGIPAGTDNFSSEFPVFSDDNNFNTENTLSVQNFGEPKSTHRLNEESNNFNDYQNLEKNIQDALKLGNEGEPDIDALLKQPIEEENEEDMKEDSPRKESSRNMEEGEEIEMAEEDEYEQNEESQAVEGEEDENDFKSRVEVGQTMNLSEVRFEQIEALDLDAKKIMWERMQEKLKSLDTENDTLTINLIIKTDEKRDVEKKLEIVSGKLNKLRSEMGLKEDPVLQNQKQELKENNEESMKNKLKAARKMRTTALVSKSLYHMKSGKKLGNQSNTSEDFQENM